MKGAMDLPHWTLILGPSERTVPWEGLLAALTVAADPQTSPPRLRNLDSLADLLETPPAMDQRGRLLLDADSTDLTELGFVSHFLGRAPRWDLWLVGSDDGSKVARRLLALPQTRWCGWPLDLDQVQRLAEAPTADPEPQPRPTFNAESTDVARSAEGPSSKRAPSPVGTSRDSPRKLEEDLAKIESILAGESLPSHAMPEMESALDTLTEADVILTPEELEAFQVSMAAETLLEEATATAEDSPTAVSEPSSAPPKWYRSQVADLADIAQRLDLALSALREQHQDADLDGELAGALSDPIERLGHDALRLVQFSRTLGYLAAPPSQGQESLRLDTLLQETLTGLADSGPERARFLFRSEGALEVRSDKGLLVQVLDALLILAGGAAGPGGEVRASAHTTADQQGRPMAELRISFPAGPLSEVPASQVLEPYGLRGKLPGLGPNALAAASRILEGQGGELLFGEGSEPDQALFILTLPVA